MDASKSLAIVIVVGMALDVSAFPASPRMPIDRIIRRAYRQSLTRDSMQNLGVTNSQMLPRAVNQLIRAVTDIQMPMVTTQIKEKVKSIHNQPSARRVIKDMSDDFVSRLHLGEILTSSRRQRLEKRSEPNYMDTMYGGFGKK